MKSYEITEHFEREFNETFSPDNAYTPTFNMCLGYLFGILNSSTFNEECKSQNAYCYVTDSNSWTVEDFVRLEDKIKISCINTENNPDIALYDGENQSLTFTTQKKLLEDLWGLDGFVYYQIIEHFIYADDFPSERVEEDDFIESLLYITWVHYTGNTSPDWESVSFCNALQEYKEAQLNYLHITEEYK